MLCGLIQRGIHDEHKHATFDLTGQVALLTGASKGMGKSMAMALAEHGSKVVYPVVSWINVKRQLLKLMRPVGKSAPSLLPAILATKSKLQALVDETRQRLGPIDTLIANAGVNPFYGASEIPDEAFDKTMNSNLRSNHWLCQWWRQICWRKVGARS